VVSSSNSLAKNYDMIMTSYHEAGHVVYGLLHYTRVEAVYLLENKSSRRIEGFTHYDSYGLDTITDRVLYNDSLNTEICILYAGLIAEKYHFRLVSGSNKFPMFLREGSSNDTLTAAALIKKYKLSLPGKKRFNYKKKLTKKIEQELKDNWEAVIIIAHGLFQKKKLHFSDLRRLLTTKTTNKALWKKKFKFISTLYKRGRLNEEVFKSILSL
jgi:ATP-dependent Zn protease